MTASRKNTTMAILVVGVVLGSLGTAGLIHGTGIPEARAQAEANLSTHGRYQVSSFSYGFGYSGPGGSNNQSKWGAYIIDTQTGDLYISVESGKPGLVGRVGQK